MSTGRRAGGPNVLLIVFDTARVDAFEPYGAPTFNWVASVTFGSWSTRRSSA